MPCHPATGLVVAERQQDTFARGKAEFSADPVGRVALAVPQMRGVEAELETVIAEFVVQTALDQLRGGIGRRAGMGADLYESYYGSILATAALGAAAAVAAVGLGAEGFDLGLKLAVAPLALALSARLRQRPTR